MKNLEGAKKKFVEYLRKNNLKVTYERKKILEEILKLNDHFDAEGLYLHFMNDKINISRATIYRTLDLLVDCELLSKIRFSENTYKYEQMWSQGQHSHIICERTGKVIEFVDSRIDEITKEIAEKYGIKNYRHNFKIIGVCKSCGDDCGLRSDDEGESTD